MALFRWLCVLLPTLLLAAPLFAAPPKTQQKAQDRPEAKAALAAGDTWREPTTGMAFVWIPAGAKGLGGGLPLHRGSCDWDEDCGWLDGFWIGKYEVTQAQWLQVMGQNPAHFAKGGAYPVESVSYAEALEFVAKLNAAGPVKFALPREAQWRHAAGFRNMLQTFAGGDQPDSLAWHKGNSVGVTHPVGGKSSSPLGVFDLHGNVAEWCDKGDGVLPPGLAATLPPQEAPKEPRAPVLGGGYDDAPQPISALRMAPEAEKSPGVGLRLLRLP